jgi:peptidoglycan hydrolase CwlO-like protein
VVSLRERLQKLTQEKKEAEAKFNKMKAKVDNTSDRIAKVQKEIKEAQKKEGDMQKSIEKSKVC